MAATKPSNVLGTLRTAFGIQDVDILNIRNGAPDTNAALAALPAGSSLAPARRPSELDIHDAKVEQPPAHWQYSADRLVKEAGDIASRLVQLDQRIFDLRLQQFQLQMDVLQFHLLDEITKREVDEGKADEVAATQALAELKEATARNDSQGNRSALRQSITHWASPPVQVDLSNLARDLYIHPWWGVMSGPADSLYKGTGAPNSRDFMGLAKDNYTISQEANVANYKLLVIEKEDEDASTAARLAAATAKQKWTRANADNYLPDRREVVRGVIAKRYATLLDGDGNLAYEKVIQGFKAMFLDDVKRLYTLMIAIDHGTRSVFGASVQVLPSITDLYSLINWLRSADNAIANAMRSEVRMLVRHDISRANNKFEIKGADFVPLVSPRIQSIRAFARIGAVGYVDAKLTGPVGALALGGVVRRDSSANATYTGPLIWNRSPIGQWSLEHITEDCVLEIEIDCIARLP